MSDKSFIDKTRDILLVGRYEEECLCSDGFKYIESTETQNCILVFGINPAGDKNNAAAEKDSSYLYYIPETSIPDRTYSPFYKPIFDIISKATNNNVKWAWCNYQDNELNTIIDKDTKLQKYRSEILNHYSRYKDKKYSLYIGEFFYYHMTNQSKFTDLVDNSRISEHYKTMLEMHIDELVKHGNSVNLILINNAEASHELCSALEGKENCTFFDYNYNGRNYRIIFAAMLSRGMDAFSKERLMNEIKEALS